MGMVNEALLRLMVGLRGMREEKGQTLAEYGLILAVIAVVVVATALIAFRTAIVGAFDSVTDLIGTVSS